MNLEQANAKLIRVKIRIKGDRCYLRGTFPPKPGHNAPRQYDVSTGCRASELKIALAKAQEIDSLLALGRFSWEPYLGVQSAGGEAETVADWLARFEADRWSRVAKTEGSLNTWLNSYWLYFQKLPSSKPLTVALLKEVICKSSQPQTRTRELFCMSYGALARFAKLDDAEIKKLAHGYKQQPMDPDSLPSDEEIVELILGVTERWQWCAGMMAAFGLRNHEVFRLDCDRIAEGVVKVSNRNKTQAGRLVYACPFEWVSLFNLEQISLPYSREDIDSSSNKILGGRLSSAFRGHGLPSPYRFRDAYAIRLSLADVPVEYASLWMGHSVSVHCKHYLDAIQERHHLEVFDKIRGKLDIVTFSQKLN